MDLISLYTSLLAEKREEYGEARDRLINGLNKLQETNAVVDTMQTQLNQLQPVLEEKAQVTLLFFCCCLLNVLCCCMLSCSPSVLLFLLCLSQVGSTILISLQACTVGMNDSCVCASSQTLPEEQPGPCFIRQ